MGAVHVVGSGASAVHFTLSLLEKGYEVVMLDVGHERPAPVLPDSSFEEMKRDLDDPSGYFLGDDFRGALLPSTAEGLYGIPPGKDYVFRRPPGPAPVERGFQPRFSFARGGLGEAWTAGCYPYGPSDLAAFPFDASDLEPCYGTVAGRIGVNGKADDLAAFFPVHEHLLPPLPLDGHSRQLLDAYGRRRTALNRTLGFYMGRTRVATLSRPAGSRRDCQLLGRCLWGCPVDALYTPSQTLRECLAYDRFTYRPGVRVHRFLCDATGRIDRVAVRPIGSRTEELLGVETLVLAAGALSTGEILLRSVHAATGETITLPGLMDNRQVHIPFLNLSMLGQPLPERAYQYHQIGIGLDGAAGESPDGESYVHCQITTLTSALMHPIIQRLPLDLATSTRIVAALQSALGLANVNFRDTRRDDNHLTLEPDGAEPRLAIRYAPDAGEPQRISAALRRLRRGLGKLRCVVPPGMTSVLPMGSSIHYAGTLPMSAEPRPLTTAPDGRSHDHPNLFVVDGSTFPFLPAKNPTFTLMANAVRIAEAAF